ncbi:hypothetical protein HT136_11170 [Novosphingobium profundi]|uniref:hypothetical protein n=1 Tax=Novosphingobium profundi TaxID=1774954 RepID=UPI001BDB397E|nr:hypothetical protein [Novosphingobium profundi]MBT0668928.1 hypothetical protein [Novosphingobium profundi]
MSPRPTSIRIFGWLLLAATLVALTTLVVFAPVLRAQALALGFAAAGPLLAMFWVCGYNLCFWYAVARRASRVSAWIFSGLTAFSLVTMVIDRAAYIALGWGYVLPTGLATLLQIAAVAMLYRGDAQGWLKARGRLPDHADIFG